jgi:hypothetical protein
LESASIAVGDPQGAAGASTQSFLGGAMMRAIFIKAFSDNRDPASSYSGAGFGVGAADVPVLVVVP